MSTAIFYDLENISKFTTPKNYGEFKASVQKIMDSPLVDDVTLQRAYISSTHPAYIKYNRFLNSTGIEICSVDPNMNSKKANLVDFKMNVDCIAYSLSNNIDTVVIVTGDADFGFLCEELKSYGKQVVVASYGITTNKSIIMVSDDWVDFSNEYSVCTLEELVNERIHLDDQDDYKSALRSVINSMLNDSLIRRYMDLKRFDLDMLKAFTEKYYRAPLTNTLDYFEFVSLLVDGLNISVTKESDRILITPSDTPVPEPELNIYETVAGMDFNFSAERFRAWHTWIDENIEAIPELIYYMNFMVNNNLLTINADSANIVPSRKCAAVLIEHTADTVSLLNIKPNDKELEKLKGRFYRNAPKKRVPTQAAEAAAEKHIYVQGTMTNYGRVLVYADDNAVIKVEISDQYVQYDINQITLRALQELREYFKGERTEFTVPVQFDGSEFQKAVWEEIRNIPYGETRTYKDIANAIHKPKSSRAVGSACNKNKLLFIIPCHRVIGTSGQLTGYAAGVELKKALLKSESSPVDFKRFGKQYLFNIKHPESKTDYISSEEINDIITEKPKASDDAEITESNAPDNQEITELKVYDNSEITEPKSSSLNDNAVEEDIPESKGNQNIIIDEMTTQPVLLLTEGADISLNYEQENKEHSPITEDNTTEIQQDNSKTNDSEKPDISEVNNTAPKKKVKNIKPRSRRPAVKRKPRTASNKADTKSSADIST